MSEKRRDNRNRNAPKYEPMIGGRIGFLFRCKNEMPMVALHWEHYFKHILNKYNSIYKVQLPKITPPVCRHTHVQFDDAQAELLRVAEA